MRTTNRRTLYVSLAVAMLVASAGCGSLTPTDTNGDGTAKTRSAVGADVSRADGNDAAADATPPENTTVTDSTSVTRGGVTFGSGN